MDIRTLERSSIAAVAPATASVSTTGIVAITIAKLADVLTTLAGFGAGFTEANSVVAGLFTLAPPPVILGAVALVSCVAVTAVTELGASVSTRVADRRAAQHTRIVGYGLFATLSLAIAVYNTALIGGWV